MKQRIKVLRISYSDIQPDILLDDWSLDFDYLTHLLDGQENATIKVVEMFREEFERIAEETAEFSE